MINKTIILFGSTGMLGSYCLYLLEKNYKVILVTRKDYDIIENNYNKLFNIIKPYNNSIIINCTNYNPNSVIDTKINCLIINSLFPKMLDKIANILNIKYIHISTNGVFNYEIGNCNELVMPNEENMYGLSKFLGEPENACVIRTSIIGEEIIKKKSLLEWVISNKNGKINGYKNYLWNGCTCLELVKLIKTIIDTDTYWKGIRHLHSMEIISKYQLVCMINEIYNLNINIIPVELEKTINKTLSSIYDNMIISKSIKDQIIEQKNTDLKLGNYYLLKKCRCCNNPNLKTIWSINKSPLAGGFLKELKDTVYEKYYPLTFLYCDLCYSGFVKEIVMENNLFTNINNNGYFYYSSQIPSLVEHFKNLYNYIKTNYNINNKKIIEIGCNDGVFLNNFSKPDNLKYLIGIDPSETIIKINNPNIITINDFFNTENTIQIIKKYGKMDYIIACNCLAHIDDINNIFKNLKLLLEDDGIIIIEVHYVKNICESLNFDFIYHEHMSYYSINGIYNICKNNNLYLENIQHISNHGGSLRITIKNKIDTTQIYNNSLLSNILQKEDISQYMDTFFNRINEWKIEICNLINNICINEKIIAGYGASGRSNIILTLIKTKFDFIFDDSVSKINNFIPLFHTKIFNSNEIYNHNIKTIFILAWPYSKYIIQKHKKFIENGGRFIIILPKIKEINIKNINKYLKT